MTGEPIPFVTVQALVGVLIGSVLTAVLQWYLTPALQRRLRAEERWESAAVELGNLLTQTIPAVRQSVLSHARSVIDYRKYETLENPRDSFIAMRMHESYVAELKDSMQRWNDLTGPRLDWLLGRVGHSNSLVYRDFELQLVRLRFLDYEVSTNELGIEDLDALFMDEARARKALIADIERLDLVSRPGRDDKPLRQARAAVKKRFVEMLPIALRGKRRPS